MKIDPSAASQLQRLTVSREPDTVNGSEANRRKAAMIAAREAQKPAAVTPTALEATRPFVPAEGESLTVPGLLEDWGQDDGMYDLDGSGAVDMADLLAFLAANGPSEGVAPTSNPGLGDEGAGFGASTPVDKGGEQPAPELTLQGLQDAWGTDDANYDLDGDGVVGMGDLTQLLARLAADASEDPAVKPAVTETGTFGSTPETTPVASDPNTSAPAPPAELVEPGSVDEIIDQWGLRDADGQVDFDDLLEGLVAGGPDDLVRPDGTSGIFGAAAPTTDGAEISNEAVPTDPQQILQDLIDGWASGKQPVDFDELLELLTKIGGASQDGGAEPGSPGRIGDALFARFSADGFGTTPPSNLPDVVGSLELNATDQKEVMKSLSQHYPDGLGVSRLA